MKVGAMQIRQNAYPVKPQHPVNTTSNTEQNVKNKVGLTEKPFSELLDKQIKEQTDIQFSAHAQRRLVERQITLSTEDLTRLRHGVNRIEEKGGRSSLILMDNTAYIVSVNNKIVVTTLTAQATSNNVFTNIDSVAIV